VELGQVVWMLKGEHLMLFLELTPLVMALPKAQHNLMYMEQHKEAVTDLANLNRLSRRDKPLFPNL